MNKMLYGHPCDKVPGPSLFCREEGGKPMNTDKYKLTDEEFVSAFKELEEKNSVEFQVNMPWAWGKQVADAQLRKLQPLIEGEIKKERGLLKKAHDIIYWMSGSSDFSPEGQSHQGWLKVQPDLEIIRHDLFGGK